MRRLLSVVALVLVLLAAGCGGSGGGTSKEEYSKDLAQAGQTLQRTLSEIVTQSGSSSSTQATGVRLEQGAKALDDAADRFDKIDPPSEAKGAHAMLVAGLHELAKVFRRGAAAARKNDTKGLTATLQGLVNSEGIKKIGEAQKELEAQGITVATTAGAAGGAGAGAGGSG